MNSLNKNCLWGICLITSVFMVSCDNSSSDEPVESAECNPECGTDERCMAGICWQKTSPKDPVESAECNPECGADEYCVDGVCRQKTSPKDPVESAECNPECGADEYCVDGVCRQKTSPKDPNESDECAPECEADEHCVDGVCWQKTSPVEPEPKGTFQAGFSRMDITPPQSLPLSGYGNSFQRMSQGYLNHLYVNCIAITDENGATALICMMDLLNAFQNAIVDPAKEAIHKATGIPQNNIFIQASHTHSAPDLEKYRAIAGMVSFARLVVNALTRAASEALSDRSQAPLEAGTIEVEGLNFIRHYILKDKQDTCEQYAGDGFGFKGDYSPKRIESHVSEADHTMQMLVFKRESTKDIMLLNFQTHAHLAGSEKSTDVTSDIVGQIRERVEEKLNVWSTYLQGAAGNINPNSRISTKTTDGDLVDINLPEENIAEDYKEYGELFNLRVQECYQNNLSNIHTGAIKIAHEKIEGRTRDKDDIEDKDPFEISALTFGDVNLICTPFEMFSSDGKYIKENDKLKSSLTLFMGYCNADRGYLPSSKTLKEGKKDDAFSCEFYEAQATFYTQGTAEAITGENVDPDEPDKNFIAMLEKLHASDPGEISYKVKQASRPAFSEEFFWNRDFCEYNTCDKTEDKKDDEEFLKRTKNVFVVTQEGKNIEKTFASFELAQDFDTMRFGVVHENDKGIIDAVGNIEDVKDAENKAIYELADGYWVTAMDGTSVTLNSAPYFNGIKKIYHLTSDTKVFLIPEPGSENVVSIKDGIRLYDRVWLVADKNEKNILTAFVDNTKYEEYKTRSNTKVGVWKWQDWNDNNGLPTTSGHYRLQQNGKLGDQASIEENAEIWLDLNGYTYEGAENKRVYALFGKGAKLTLMDSGKDGGLKAVGNDMQAEGAVLWARCGHLYVYNGNYDASNVKSSRSGTVIASDQMIEDDEKSCISYINIYGGKFLGGVNEGSENFYHGGNLSVRGTGTIYHGEFIGGEVENGGGGIVFVDGNGKLTIHGGSFTGGKSNEFGGCFYIAKSAKSGTEPLMSMTGGEISDCTGPNGSVLYAEDPDKVIIFGNSLTDKATNNPIKE